MSQILPRTYNVGTEPLCGATQDDCMPGYIFSNVKPCSISGK
jgi:hypothetical protein